MISWQRDLESASTPTELVQLTRRFLASLSPREMAELPADCRPARLETGADLRQWSRRLTDAYWAMRSTAADVTVIQEIWSFFLRASIQLARIEETRTVP